MILDQGNRETMKKEIERILKRDTRFGPLHHLELSADDELMLVWDNATLRQRSKAQQGPYLAFMEEISDCLLEFGYCLAAEDGANEQEKNNYLLILPENDEDLYEES